MRVAHIHFWGDAANFDGSVEKVIQGFCINAQEYQPEVYSVGCSEPKNIHGVNYHYFAENRVLNRVANKWFGMKKFVFGSLISLIKQRKPDILHFHNRQDLVDLVVRRLDYRPKVVVHYHRHFPTPSIPMKADLLLGVSQSVANHIQSFSDSIPISYIYNPVPAWVQKHQKTSKHSTPPPVILYGGGKQAHKGYFELLKAAQKIDDNFLLELAGPKLEKKDSSGGQNKIISLGSLTHEQFLKHLIRADIVVIPSHHEGCPILLLEAFGLGKIVVASDAKGINEVTGEKIAFTHKTADSEDLLKALKAALLSFHKGEAKQKADKSMTFARAFSPVELQKILCQKYREIYDVQ